MRAAGVVLGLMGALLSALGSVAHGFSMNRAGWGWGPVDALATRVSLPGAALPLFLGALALVWGWWLLRPRPGRPGADVRWVAALWSLPFLVAPPYLTSDPFAYVELGWLQANGRNPCCTPLGSLGGPYAAWVDDLWLGKTLGYYPPLSLALNRWGLELLGPEPYWAMVGQRVVALAGLVLLLAVLRPLARSLGREPDMVIWLGGLNPLVVLLGVGGAHVDLVMVALVACSLRVATMGLPPRVRFVASALVLGLTIAIKPYAAIAAVAVVGVQLSGRARDNSFLSRVWALGWRSALAGFLAGGVVLLTGWVTGLGSHWLGALTTASGRLPSMSPSTLGADLVAAFGRLLGTDGVPDYATADRVALVAAFLAALAVLVGLAGQPVRAAAWGALVVVLGVSALLPWYLLLAVTLLSLSRPREWEARLAVHGVGAVAVSNILFLFASHWVEFAAFLWVFLALLIGHRTLGRNEPVAAPYTAGIAQDHDKGEPCS